MVKAMVTLCENGTFAFYYYPGKTPKPKEGHQKVITLPEKRALEINKIEDAHNQVQEELYEAFYADDYYKE